MESDSESSIKWKKNTKKREEEEKYVMYYE